MESILKDLGSNGKYLEANGSSDERDSVVGSDHDTQIEEIEDLLSEFKRNGDTEDFEEVNKSSEADIEKFSCSSSEEDHDEEWTVEKSKQNSSPTSLREMQSSSSPNFDTLVKKRKKSEKATVTSKISSIKRRTNNSRVASFIIPPKVKKPRTAYAIYSSMNQRIIKQELEEEGKDSSHSEVLKTVGSRWKNMLESEKSMYERLAEEDKQRYSRDIQFLNNYTSNSNSSLIDSSSLSLNSTTKKDLTLSRSNSRSNFNEMDEIQSTEQNASNSQSPPMPKDRTDQLSSLRLSQMRISSQEEREEIKILLLRKKGSPFYERFALPKSEWNLQGLISKIKSKLGIIDITADSPSISPSIGSSTSNSSTETRGLIKIKITNSGISTSVNGFPNSSSETVNLTNANTSLCSQKNQMFSSLLSKHKIDMILNLPDILVTDDEGVRLLPNESKLEVKFFGS